MASIKPSVPKGTRDFSPAEMARRNFIFDTIKAVFRKFGYQQIETPSMENRDTLMGKYGDEGDKLIFKILESGEYSEKAVNELIISLEDSNIKEDVQKTFEALAKDFSVFLSSYDFNLISEKEDLIWELPSNHFNDLNISPEHFYPIKKGFVNYLFRKGKSEKFKRFKNRVNYYASIKDPNLRQEEIFKGLKYILNNDTSFRVFLNAEISTRKHLSSQTLSTSISKKALRYDLTVPFARYVVMHQNEITFPFKRFQVQPVWRADRPQKGRYREFFQCDADVVGSNSLLNEAEFVLIYDEALSKLGLTDFTVKINNRKILSGIAEVVNKADQIVDMTVAIDKLDKIGLDGVTKELLERGFSAENIEQIKPIILLQGTTEQKLASLRSVLAGSPIGMKGCDELETVFNYLKSFKLQRATVELDITLARGLNYYTGAIFEVKTNQVQMGSIGGGGRYDDLTGMFGLKDLTGVGISFGADRIYDVLEELKLFPDATAQSTQVLICPFDVEGETYALPLLQQLREAGVNAELYPAGAKVKKQLDYANNKHIPFVVMIGSDEMQNGLLSLKDMQSGTQEKLSAQQILEKLS